MKIIITIISFVYSAVALADQDKKTDLLFENFPSLIFDNIYTSFYEFANEFNIFTPEGNAVIIITLVLGVILQLKKLFLDSNGVEYKEMFVTTLWFIFMYSCIFGGHYRSVFPSVWSRADTVSSGLLRGESTLDRDTYNLIKYYANVASAHIKGDGGGILEKYRDSIRYKTFTDSMCEGPRQMGEGAECLDKWNLGSTFDKYGMPTEDSISNISYRWKQERSTWLDGVRPDDHWGEFVTGIGFVPSSASFFSLILSFLASFVNFFIHAAAILLQLIMVIEAVTILFFFKSLCPLVVWSGGRSRIMGLFKTWLSFAILSFVFELLMKITDTVALSYFRMLNQDMGIIKHFASSLSEYDSLFSFKDYISVKPSMLTLQSVPYVGVAVVILSQLIIFAVIGIKIMFLSKLVKISKGLMNLQFDELIGLADGAVSGLGKAAVMGVSAVATGGAAFMGARAGLNAGTGKVGGAVKGAGKLAGKATGKMSSLLSGARDLPPPIGGGSGGPMNLSNESGLITGSGLASTDNHTGSGNPPPITPKFSDKNKVIKTREQNPTVGNSHVDELAGSGAFSPPTGQTSSTSTDDIFGDNQGVNLFEGKNFKLGSRSNSPKVTSTTPGFDDSITPSNLGGISSNQSNLKSNDKDSPEQNKDLVLLLSDIKSILESIANNGIGEGDEDDDQNDGKNKGSSDDKDESGTKPVKDEWKSKKKLNSKEAEDIDNLAKSIESKEDEKPLTIFEQFKADKERIKNSLGGVTAVFGGISEFSENLSIGESLNEAVDARAKIKDLKKSDSLKLFDTNSDGEVSREELTEAYLEAKKRMGEGFQLSDMSYGMYHKLMKKMKKDSLSRVDKEEGGLI